MPFTKGYKSQISKKFRPIAKITCENYQLVVVYLHSLKIFEAVNWKTQSILFGRWFSPHFFRGWKLLLYRRIS